jgi:hypothetical protein
MADAKMDQRAEKHDVVQGHIYWLPSKEELPGRAIRRAHGKGAIEEGIYSHPIVIVSHPAEEGHVVHFHLVSTGLLNHWTCP